MDAKQNDYTEQTQALAGKLLEFVLEAMAQVHESSRVFICRAALYQALKVLGREDPNSPSVTRDFIDDLGGEVVAFVNDQIAEGQKAGQVWVSCQDVLSEALQTCEARLDTYKQAYIRKEETNLSPAGI